MYTSYAGNYSLGYYDDILELYSKFKAFTRLLKMRRNLKNKYAVV